MMTLHNLYRLATVSLCRTLEREIPARTSIQYTICCTGIPNPYDTVSGYIASQQPSGMESQGWQKSYERICVFDRDRGVTEVCDPEAPPLKKV